MNPKVKKTRGKLKNQKMHKIQKLYIKIQSSGKNKHN